ncbi:hypothetical protein P7K49_020803 [Saguinus oedipus]|uniref:Uncharacterized protein n=1 Tax=Saguinus oedipus TaxID=9490 RepID=A0ABQ9UQV9_SAGOE|nr:hypothetical protein P7K49_020803 [Saguinus oedipus]
MKVPVVVIDSYYYGRLVIAPLNIVLYNVFTPHGPDLYGRKFGKSLDKVIADGAGLESAWEESPAPEKGESEVASTASTLVVSRGLCKSLPLWKLDPKGILEQPSENPIAEFHSVAEVMERLLSELLDHNKTYPRVWDHIRHFTHSFLYFQKCYHFVFQRYRLEHYTVTSNWLGLGTEIPSGGAPQVTSVTLVAGAAVLPVPRAAVLGAE